MDRALRCNSLKCRKELKKQAVVTTCSHIFCLECANLLHLANPPPGQQRLCPACDTPLLNLDDAVIANLVPTDDYKTSVLSGLSPNIIMECAGRALSFWAYQNTQELVYQEYQARTLTEKYSTLSVQMDKIVNDANAEISGMRKKLSNLHVNYDELGRKNAELMHALRERTRIQLQTQELYDKLKRRAMLTQVQNAASAAVDHNIQASASGNRFPDPLSETNQAQCSVSQFSEGQGNITEPNLNSNLDYGIPTAPNAQVANAGGTSRWNGPGNQENNQSNVAQTPSSHRQRLNTAGNNELAFSSSEDRRINVIQGGTDVPRLSNLQHAVMNDTPISQRRDPPHRSPLAVLNTNATVANGFAGYGMSAGIKVSHLPRTFESANYSVRPTVRSRVANRPASTTLGAGHIPSLRGPAINQFHTLSGCY